MHAAVELLYREGLKNRPQWPPLVGQLFTHDFRGIPQLRLYPLEWVANSPDSYTPLSTLWHPSLTRVSYNELLFRGFEAWRMGAPVAGTHKSGFAS
jgi:hypothetical protein